MVSVIMPVYNAEKFLESAIESVISQTYFDWELIIVDDCSTDGSSNIISKYTKQDERISSYTTDFPSGTPAEPRNVGIEKAKGRYIAFLDSDDIWLSNKLNEQMLLFDTKNPAVVFSNYEKINELGVRNKRIISAPTCTCYKQLLHGNVIANSTGVYDTCKVGKAFFKKIHHEDYVLWLSILKNGHSAHNTNTVTMFYRIRQRSVSSNKIKALSWQWHIYTNVEKLGYIKSAYYFTHYIVKAFMKAYK